MKQKSTSRDANSKEFSNCLRYFTESCKAIHEWNKVSKCRLDINVDRKTFIFDAMVRLITEHSEGHLWECSGTTQGMMAPVTASFDSDHGSQNSGSTCENMLMIQLDNDRREWFSSIQIQNEYTQMKDLPTQFSLYARNSDNEEWTLIRAVTGLVYSMAGQGASPDVQLYSNHSVLETLRTRVGICRY